MLISFQELKKKCVIDLNSGKNLGKVCDLFFEKESGYITKLVVSGSKNSFFSSNKTQIEFSNIVKIGDDSILYKKSPPKKDNCLEEKSSPCNNPCSFEEE
jgi:YlmC/YmxH family sporulation protein